MITAKTVVISTCNSNDNERPADVDHNDIAQLNNVLWAMAKAESRDMANG